MVHKSIVSGRLPRHYACDERHHSPTSSKARTTYDRRTRGTASATDDKTLRACVLGRTLTASSLAAPICYNLGVHVPEELLEVMVILPAAVDEVRPFDSAA